MQAGKRYTTYVSFNPETYSLEQEDKQRQKQLEIARLLVREYVPLVRSAEMMGLIGAGNNPMVGMTVAVAVAIEEALK